MRNILGVVVVALALAGPGAALAKGKVHAAAKKVAPKDGETISLKKGETKTLSIPDVMRVAVGDPRIADIQVGSAGTLRVKGGSEGKTTLLVWTSDNARKSYLLDVK